MDLYLWKVIMSKKRYKYEVICTMSLNSITPIGNILDEVNESMQRFTGGLAGKYQVRFGEVKLFAIETGKLLSDKNIKNLYKILQEQVKERLSKYDIKIDRIVLVDTIEIPSRIISNIRR